MQKYYALIVVALAIALGLGTASAACIAPSANVTQWWMADGTAKDARGDNDAMLQNGATYGPGLVGQAFQLDGVDDFVSVPNGPGLDFGMGDFTLNFWVKFNDTNTEQVMIEKYVETFNPNTAIGWSFPKRAWNALQFAVTPLDVDSPIQTIPTGTWIHLAMRRSGDVFTMFMNGATIASETFHIDLSTTSSLKLGYPRQSRGYARLDRYARILPERVYR